MKVHCPSREKLTAWLCEELAAAEADALLVHLQGCPQCEAVVQELEREAEALLELGVPAIALFGGRTSSWQWPWESYCSFLTPILLKG
jgi:anti-sigma factor RsiW